MDPLVRLVRGHAAQRPHGARERSSVLAARRWRAVARDHELGMPLVGNPQRPSGDEPRGRKRRPTP